MFSMQVMLPAAGSRPNTVRVSRISHQKVGLAREASGQKQQSTVRKSATENRKVSGNTFRGLRSGRSRN